MNKKEAIELAKSKKKNGIGRVGCQMSNGRDQLKIRSILTFKIPYSFIVKIGFFKNLIYILFIFRLNCFYFLNYGNPFIV